MLENTQCGYKVMHLGKITLATDIKLINKLVITFLEKKNL